MLANKYVDVEKTNRSPDLSHGSRTEVALSFIILFGSIFDNTMARAKQAAGTISNRSYPNICLASPPCSTGRVHSELVESQTALCGEKKSYVLRSNRVKLGVSAPEG